MSDKEELINKMKDVLRQADVVCCDVDSTVCEDETIDQLAEFCGVSQQVKMLTSQAMNGDLSYRESLRDRLNLMKPSLQTIQQFLQKHPPKLTPGVRELVGELRARGAHVYLVSGGLESILIHVADDLGLSRDHVIANRLFFYHDGQYAGFDVTAPTSVNGGKSRVAEYLRSKHGYKTVVFVGDGATDLETYPGAADGFIGFGGNMVRDHVRDNAPWFVHSFDEISKVLRDK